MPILRPLLGALLAAAAFHPAHIQARSLQSLATDIAKRDAEFSQLWPGYWPPGQPFVLYRGKDCVMRSVQEPAGFTRIDNAPDLWRGRCDEPRFKGPMLLRESIGGIRAPAVEIVARRDSVESATTFLLHEAFHDYQADAFEKSERIRTDFAFPLDPELVQMKLRETNLIVSAANNDDKLAAVTIVRAAIATRNARLARMPAEARAIEDQYLAREGTAQYVDIRAGTLVREEGSALDYVHRALGRDRAFGRTWEHLLRWQSYSTGAAAGLFLDRWNVDWKPHVAKGRPVYDILAIATGYDEAAHGNLAELSSDVAGKGMARKAREMIASDRAGVRALERFEKMADVMLELVDPGGSDTSASFTTTSALVTVPGGVVVMSPQPFNSASESAELQVRGRPLRLFERDEEDATSRSRVEIALSKAPQIEGCAADADTCGAGTRLDARGVKLELRQPHRIERTPTRWRLVPVDDAG